MYFHANFDAQGEPLNGRHAYRWRVPPGGVPAEAFWSLTMYEAMPDGRYFLVDNPIQRYAIGDRTRRPDGEWRRQFRHSHSTRRAGRRTRVQLAAGA